MEKIRQERLTGVIRTIFLTVVLFAALLAGCNFAQMPAAPTGLPTVEVTDAPAGATFTPDEPLATLVESPQAVPDLPLDPGELTVVYTRGGELWRWRDGQAARIAAGVAYAPKISPDSRTVAFLRQADAFHQELWAVEIDGSDERKLVGVVDLDKIGGGVRDASALAINPHPDYSWIPGSRSVAFTTYQVFNGPGAGLLNDLHYVDADNAQITNIFLKDWGGMFVFSPDGANVAVAQTEKIILAAADGSNYTQVMSYPPVITYSEAAFYAEPHWSPGGDFLRVAMPPVDALAAPDQATALWRISAGGSPPVQEGSVTAVVVIDTPVIYSPDLERIAFIRETSLPEGTRRELHLATFDGAGDWMAAFDPMLLFAGWAPDGRRFIYTVGENQEMMLGSLDAAAQPFGPAQAGAIELRWIDNHRLLYLRRVADAFEMVLFDVDLSRSLMLDSITGARPAFDWIKP